MNLDPRAAKLDRTLRYERQVLCCRRSRDGDVLFGAGFDGKLHRWNLAQNDAHESYPGHEGWVETMVMNPDRSRLFTADSWGKVICWSIEDRQPAIRWSVPRANSTWLRRVAISPSGDQVATCGNDRMVRVFATSDGRLIRELQGHAHPVLSLAFHPDGRSLATGDLFGIVKTWDLAAGRTERNLEASKLYKKYQQYDQGGVRCMTFDAAGAMLYCAGFEGTNANQAQGTPTVVALDWRRGTVERIMTPRSAFTGPILDIVHHESGYLLGIGSSEAGGALWFWKAGQDKDEHEIRYANSFRGLDLHTDGVRLTIAAFGNRDGQRGGNGRRLVNGAYVDFEGSIAFYSLM